MIRIALMASAALCLAPFSAHAAKSDAAAEQQKQITEAHFVKFQPILMSVVQDRQIKGLVQLDIAIRLADPSKWEATTRLRSRIRDGLVQSTAGMTRGAIRVDAPLNIPLITAVLQRSVDKVLGPDYAQVLVLDASTRVQ